MERRSVARFGISVGVIAIAAVLYGSAATADEHGRTDEYSQANEYSQIRSGYQIISEIFPKGTKLNFAGKDPALVGLGSYLVNSTGCNDCHTHPNYAPNHNPYLGQPEQLNIDVYLSGGRQFGPIKSANLTPDQNGRPAGLTLAGFLEVMHTGHDPRDAPGDILQVMPWPLYQWKTDHDLTAMYEYLRVIPPLPDNPNPGP
jgi:hypothetical protein